MQKSSPKKKVFKKQEQPLPGLEAKMDPQPEFDRDIPGNGRLEGKRCIITGGDSGIGRSVAIAFAKEGADVAIVFLEDEREDAEFTVKYIKDKYGKKCVPVSADLSREENCKKAVSEIKKHFTAMLSLSKAMCVIKKRLNGR